MTKMHADERDIPVALVRSLIDTQFPQWRELVITIGNITCCLGRRYIRLTQGLQTTIA